MRKAPITVLATLAFATPALALSQGADVTLRPISSTSDLLIMAAAEAAVLSPAEVIGRQVYDADHTTVGLISGVVDNEDGTQAVLQVAEDLGLTAAQVLVPMTALTRGDDDAIMLAMPVENLANMKPHDGE